MMRAGIFAVVMLFLVSGFLVAGGNRDGIVPGDPPDTAFGLAGTDLLFDWHDDFRWSYGAPELTIQTTENEVYQVEVINDNVMRLTRGNDKMLLLRIGSPEYQAMQAFRECVDRNRGRNLFEVEECTVPFELPDDEPDTAGTVAAE